MVIKDQCIIFVGNMKNVFIDCGSHDGCSVRKFIHEYDKNNDFNYYCFEMNRLLKDYYCDLNENLKSRLKIIFKAVSDGNGSDTMLRMGLTGGSTIDKRKASGLYEKQFYREDAMLFDFYQISKNADLQEERVKTIDLAEWILKNFSDEDYIVLKMDIEGAEYKIINHLIRKGCFKIINELKIEFHSGYEKKDTKYKNLILNQNKNIKIDDKWDAMHPPYLINEFSEEYYKTYIRDGIKQREPLSDKEKMFCICIFMNALNHEKFITKEFYITFKTFLNKYKLVEYWKKFILDVSTEKIKLYEK